MKYNDNGIWKDLNVKVTDTLPVGTIIPYAGTTIPSNYMLCEGQELSRIEYDILFSAIGTTYGAGDGSTTFNLPNLKGRVITGIDSNDTDFDTLGETGGEKTHTLTVEEIPSHAHEQLAVANPNSGGTGIRGTYNGESGNGMNRYPTHAQTEPTGGGQPHNNLQPYIVLNYIIKVLDAPAIQAQVVNNENDSKLNAYSCDYINNKVKDVYSTDEVKTNKVWIDGKPIYRKVFTGTKTSATINQIGNIANLDTMVLLTGFIKSSFGQWWDIPNYYFENNNTNYWTSVYHETSGTINLNTGSNFNTSSKYRIIAEYTKTTD